MKLEDLVPNLDLCKELKENGYPQDSYFHWSVLPRELYYIELSQPNTVSELADWYIGNNKTDDFKIYAAPTSGEIGEQLKAFPMINYAYYPDVWITQIPRDENRSPVWTPAFTEYSEADSRAKMWLFLKQENLLQSSQENK